MPRRAVNGISLNVEQAGSGPPLVLLHGFTGSTANWTPHIESFGRSFTTYAIDLIGHGASDSPADPARYEMVRAVDDLICLLDILGIESTGLLGYSMGGRVALHLVLAAPERFRAVVLESASPGIADPLERAARVRADESLAASIERDGLEAFIDRWQGLPLFASQQRLPLDVQQRHREQRLANNPIGLANSLRGMGAGAMNPLWDQLHEIAIPMMLIAGELDRKYVDLGEQMARQISTASRLAIAAVGHATHLESPKQFERTVSEWISDTYREGSADASDSV